MSVVVIVPVLRRPHRVIPLVESFAASGAEGRLLFVASPSDLSEQKAIKDVGADLLVLDRDPMPGDYSRKINNAYRCTDEPLLFLGADDLHFHPGWLAAAVAELGGRVEVVGTNDMGNQRVMRGTHATHSLVTRSYIDEQGTVDAAGRVLHEGYHHNFVDDEFVATAKLRGAFGFAVDSRVEHLHPLWNKAENDATYRRGLARFDADRRLFQKRQQMWGFVRG